MAKMPAQKPRRSKQDYATPPAFVEAVKRRLGIDHFAIDLAADATNHKADFYYDEAVNALSQSWANDAARLGSSDWCWLNPPFADIAPWAKKCWEESQRGCQIALLVPAAVGANWYRDWVHGKARRVLFLNGRLAFIPDQPHLLYPKDCLLALYEPDHWPGTEYDVWNWREEP